MDAQERNNAAPLPEESRPDAMPDTPANIAEDTAADTPDAAAPQSLEAWWAAGFPEKEFLNLSPDGRLSLKETAYFPERQLAVLQPGNAAGVFEELRAKYQEAAARVEKLSADWQAAEDNMKLQSRVRGLRDYLMHVPAAGDLQPFFAQLVQWEEQIKSRQEGNVQNRKDLVAQAEQLAESNRWKEGAQQFRDLEEKWKQAPTISREENEVLRQRLDTAKNRFYERRRQHQEEVEKDMAQSLDLKLEIVEKAEKLAASDQWKAATEGFRELMDQWKQTGKTFSDKQEELWQRFQAAKTAFHDRKRLHHQEIQGEQEENYTKKLALVEEAEALQNQTNWQATAKQFERIQQQWNKIGRVPQEKSEELWQRLHKAKDTFYGNRRQHNEQLIGQLQENLAKKEALIKRAEQISQATEWREGTEEMNALMAEWKKIGPAPREQNEKVWEQFLAARKQFFERKDAHREQHKQRMAQQQDRRLHQTQNFLATLEGELREEETNLADFRESLGKLTTGPKEEELRRHLQHLIAQSEKAIERRNRKISEVREQLEDLQNRQRPEKRQPAPAATLSRQPESEQAAESSESIPQSQQATEETPPASGQQPEAGASENETL